MRGQNHIKDSDCSLRDVFFPQYRSTLIVILSGEPRRPAIIICLQNLNLTARQRLLRYDGC